MKKVAGTLAIGALSVALLGGVGFNTYLSTKTLDKMQTMDKKIYELNAIIQEETKGSSNENEFVTIGETYEIRDTKKLSDAYISGNYEGLSEKEKETIKMAEDVIKEVIKKDMSNYEKELAIHDWIAKNVGFDESSLAALPNSDEYTFTPYGVLLSRNAVCVGYATTFKLFMNMLGMDCRVVHDTELSHSWDLVEVEKGEWYYVDLYFDSNEGEVSHTNFNLTQAEMLSNHSFNTTGLPEANSIKYNYFMMNAVELKDIMDMPKLMKDALDKREEMVIFKMSNLDQATLVAYIEALNSIANRISQNMNDFSEDSDENYIYAELVTNVDDPGNQILGLAFHYSSKEDEDEETETKKDKKLYALIDELFGTETDYSDELDSMGGVNTDNLENTIDRIDTEELQDIIAGFRGEAKG